MNIVDASPLTQEVFAALAMAFDRRRSAAPVPILAAQERRTCAPPGSVPGKPPVGHDKRPGLMLMLVSEGSETVHLSSGGEVQLTEGMFMLWDPAWPVNVAATARLRSVPLPVSEVDLLRRMPRARDLVGQPIDGQQGAGGLFADHLRSLILRFDQLPEASREPVLNATLDLLAVCLREQVELPLPRLRQLTLQEVQRHIETSLGDPELNVASLARTFRMSERNVHKLFAGTGATASAYIRNQRLAMCRRDLACRALRARQISEIALHWGFKDPGHFGKAFRAAYGVSPSIWRAQARTSAATQESP